MTAVPPYLEVKYKKEKYRSKITRYSNEKIIDWLVTTGLEICGFFLSGARALLELGSRQAGGDG